MRAQVDLLSSQQGRGRVPRSRVNPRGGEEEGCRKDFEEETEYKKKLDEQKKSLQRQVREIDKFANMDLVVRNQQKEAWKKELGEFEKKKGQSFCRSIRRCRRSHKSCKVCEINRTTTLRRLENVKMKCKRSVKNGRSREHSTRCDSTSC